MPSGSPVFAPTASGQRRHEKRSALACPYLRPISVRLAFITLVIGVLDLKLFEEKLALPRVHWQSHRRDPVGRSLDNPLVPGSGRSATRAVAGGVPCVQNRVGRTTRGRS